MFSAEELKQLFTAFNKLKVIVVGDIMLDSYIWGKVERISPEAPVPVVAVRSRNNRLGGAANVAVNLKSLGAEPLICSVIGQDGKGDELTALMDEELLSTKGIVRSPQRLTTTKFRIIGNKVQMLRVDEEMTDDLTEAEENLLSEKIASIVKQEKIHAIIFQDYNKGILTKGLIAKTLDIANKHDIITTVDPKKKNFGAFKNITLFKPNLKELSEGINKDLDANDKEGLTEAALSLHKQLDSKVIMTTLSENGVFISHKSNSVNHTAHMLPAFVRSVADVSGAGDTVISIATLCLILNQSTDVIAGLANLAGGLVCEEVGVVPVNKEKLYLEALKLLIK